MTTPTLTIPLPWTKPPLSDNDRGISRGAKFARNATVRDIQYEIHTLAKAHKLPRNIKHVAVTLHYAPRDNRRRDVDNLNATAKPIYDALAGGSKRIPGYGMVPDDTPELMTKLMPVIHPKSTTGKGQLWLEIEVTQ